MGCWELSLSSVYLTAQLSFYASLRAGDLSPRIVVNRDDAKLRCCGSYRSRISADVIPACLCLRSASGSDISCFHAYPTSIASRLACCDPIDILDATACKISQEALRATLLCPVFHRSYEAGSRQDVLFKNAPGRWGDSQCIHTSCRLYPRTDALALQLYLVRADSNDYGSLSFKRAIA